MPAIPATAGHPSAGPGRAPKASRPRKAAHADECKTLEQLPNIGPSMAADLRLLGVHSPADLRQREPLEMYQGLCRLSGRRQDPCVLDTFMAATDFMSGADRRPWWAYTAERKRRFDLR